jgi:hypothetical protein
MWIATRNKIATKNTIIIIIITSLTGRFLLPYARDCIHPYNT